MAEAGNFFFFFLEPAFVLDWPQLVTRPGGGTELERIRAPIHSDRSPQVVSPLPQAANFGRRSGKGCRGVPRHRTTPRTCKHPGDGVGSFPVRFHRVHSPQHPWTVVAQTPTTPPPCRSDTHNATLMSRGRPEEIRDGKRETVSGRGSRRLTVKTTSEMRALARVPVTCNRNGKRGVLRRGSDRNGRLEEGVRSPS